MLLNIGRKIYDKIENISGYLKRDILFQYTVISLFIKSLFFVLLLPSPNASKIDASHAFVGVPPFFVYFCFIILILSIAFIFRNRAHLWCLILINLLFSLLLIFDLWYYRGYSSLITPYLLKETPNLQNLESSLVSMMRFIDIFFIFDICIFIFLAFRNPGFYSNFNKSMPVFLFLFAGSVLCIELAYYKIDVLKMKYPGQMLFRKSWSVQQNISNLSPVGYHFYDAYNYLKESKPQVLSDTQKCEITGWFDRKQENLPDNKYKGLFKGKNLIILQVESLENFIINRKIDGQEITPNLNKLLKNSIYFSDYYEQVYNGTSCDADLMTNTSVYPVRSGCAFFRFPCNTYNSLPNMMERTGYETTAIHPDRGSYWNWMPALKSIGFNRCIDSTSFQIDEFINLGLSDGSYLRQVEPIIRKQKQPFYTFMVTLTSHGPFNLPKKYKELKLEKYIEKTKLGKYFECIHYTDKQIGNFIDSLSKDHILDNSVFVVYGDHCGIHKFYQDEVNGIKPAQNWWKENNRKIPLIIYYKGMKPEVKNIIGGQIDLMPTIAYLMGIDPSWYEKTALGRNLLNTNRNYAVLSNKTYVGDDSSYEKDAVEGIELSNEIIQSNYFKNKY